MPWTNPLPPDTRAVGTGNPPGDMDGVVDALTAMGATYNVQNPAYSGGADPTGAADSTAAIQAALTAGAGKRVYLPAGTYLISSDLSVPSGTTVYGDGRSTILLAAAGAYSGTTGPNLLKVSSASRVVIRDLTFNGNSANITYGGQFNYLHGGVGITYTQLQGVFILSSDDVTVEDCWFHDGFSSGIMAMASTNLIIRGNRLTACGDNQIYVRALNTTPYTPNNYVTITGNVASGGAYSGIQVLSSSHIAITGNVCYSNGPSAGQGNGIGSEGASYVTITGNSCYANGVQGINIRFTSEVGANQRSSHVVVSSNVCYSHTSTDGDAGGINISDTDDGLITGNLIYGNYYGINVSNGGNGLSVLNLDIQGNIVRGSAAIGIRLAPGNASAYTISGNDVSGGSTVGIYANQQAWVKNNTVRGNTSFGIQFDTGAGNSIAEGNTVYDNGDNGIHVGGTGVANCVINDNYCTNVSGTQPRGIYEATGNGPTIALNNYITGQVTAPYAFNNASSVYNTLDNGAGQASFSGSASTGALVTLDATVRPNPGRSTSASLFLDNTAGQIYEFFCSSGGSFGVFDGTHSVQPFTINSNPSCTFSMTGNAIAIATGNIDVGSAGFGLKVAEGSNAKQGTATLVAGTKVVANTSVTANSRIFLTCQSLGTVSLPSALCVSVRTAGTSFTILASQPTDTSVVAYELFEPG